MRVYKIAVPLCLLFAITSVVGQYVIYLNECCLGCTTRGIYDYYFWKEYALFFLVIAWMLVFVNVAFFIKNLWEKKHELQ